MIQYYTQNKKRKKMNPNQEHQMEITLEELEGHIDKAEMLARLQQNPDFKTLFLDGYLKAEPVRLTLLLGDKAIKAEKADVFLQLESISGLAAYLRNVKIFGEQMRIIKDRAEETEV